LELANVDQTDFAMQVVAKARFMSTQIAKIHQAKGKFGVNSTWVSMYEASAQQNNWPSLETVGGFLTLVNEVYLPIASRLLALPEIASELADVMIEDELADPKHQLEMKIERLSTLLSKAKETSRGGIKVAVIEADASIAVGTGAELKPVDFELRDISDSGQTNSFVFAIADDHALAGKP